MNDRTQAMVGRAETYFRDVDNFDTDAIISYVTEDVVLEVPTHGVRKEGLEAVRQTYIDRAKNIKKSWHGNFKFMSDEVEGRLAIRLAVRRTNAAGIEDEMDNLTLLSFAGDLICGITVWMAGENSLN